MSVGARGRSGDRGRRRHPDRANRRDAALSVRPAASHSQRLDQIGACDNGVHSQGGGDGLTPHSRPSGRDIEFKLSLLYAATFLTFGVQIPFLPVWLGSRGLDDRHIALALAAPQFLRVVSTPLLARW